MSDVNVIYGSDPSELINELFSKTPEYRKLFNSEDRVVLKPNVLLPKESHFGATTDPGLVGALIKELRGLGVKDIKIAEGAWVGADTGRSFRVCGYESLDVPLIDLKKDEYETMKLDLNSSGLKRIKISKTVLNATKIINLPVLKAHCQAKLTCGMKNFMGVISDGEKRRFHQVGLDVSIFELNTLLKPVLNICDAIVGDLTFEEGGTPVKFGQIFASTDIYSFDSYAASVLGYTPKEIGYLRLYKNHFKVDGELRINNLNEPSEIKDYKAVDYRSRFKSHINPCDACCSCLASIFTALETGGLDDDNLGFYVGMKVKEEDICPGKQSVFVGNCTRKFRSKGVFVEGCPATGSDIKKALKNRKG